MRAPCPRRAAQHLISVLDYVFTIVFAVEAGLKLIGLTPAVYAKSRWNLLDFFIVVVSIISELLRGP